MKRMAFICTVLAVGLSGCGPKPAVRHDIPAPAAPVPTPPAPGPHSWSYRVGQDYAYQADADPRKPGPTAVQVYRYLGQRDGLYAIRINGETATCANPCQVITLHAGGFHLERLDFDPDSLIGAAFTDAFNGQLQVYDPTKG